MTRVKPVNKARSAKKAGSAKKTGSAKKARPVTKAKRVKLLAGGNPQIAKADGDVPVQTYIAAMPGWKSGVGKRLDAVIPRSVPNVRKALT